MSVDSPFPLKTTRLHWPLAGRHSAIAMSARSNSHFMWKTEYNGQNDLSFQEAAREKAAAEVIALDFRFCGVAAKRVIRAKYQGHMAGCDHASAGPQRTANRIQDFDHRCGHLPGRP